MTAYVNVNGEICTEATLYVPNVGPWWAEVIFQDAPDISGQVILSLGELQLTGTVSPGENGVFAGQRKARIVAGGGGWGTLIAPQGYHNDAGVRALTVAQDAARLAGETLGSFEPAADSVGIDYVRQSGQASTVLENVIGSAVPWHVDYSGETIVGERATSEPSADDYQVLDFNPRERLLTLAVDDLRLVTIGAVLSESLEEPVTVRELQMQVTADESRVIAWVGGTATGRGRLAGLVRGMVERVLADKLFGKYKYRVVQMATDRVELQVVSQAVGLPDVLPVSMKPGVAGAHSKLTAGMHVLVEFLEGSRAEPFISAFAGKGDEGHVTDELVFSVTTSLKLGSDAATEGVTLGDSHKSWADGHTHTYNAPLHPAVPVTLQTSPPSSAVGIPDPAPSPSSKVKVDA